MKPDQLLCTDCLPALQALPSASVDLCFADPPFNIGFAYDVYEDQRTASDYLSWSRLWISEVHRVLKPDGTFWLAIGDDYAAELKLLAQDVGFHCRSWCIWHYTLGVNCPKKFTRSHTHLLYFVKNPKRFTFRAHDPLCRVQSERQRLGDKRANPDGRLPDDVWQFSRIAGTHKERVGFHGCQMPEALLGRIASSGRVRKLGNWSSIPSPGQPRRWWWRKSWVGGTWGSNCPLSTPRWVRSCWIL